MNAVSCKSTCRVYSKPAAAPRVAPLAPPQRRHSHRAPLITAAHSDADAAFSPPSSSWQHLRHTQPAAAAAIVTGVYATLAGAALALAPRTTFGLLFDAAAVPVGWVRVGGVLFATFGLQYLGAGLGDARLLAQQQQQQQLADAAAAAAPSPAPAPTSSSSASFYEASVWSRLFLAAAFAALVAAGAAEPGLLVLAAVNAFGAVSMRAALRRKQAIK
jgi:hypothetical protein